MNEERKQPPAPADDRTIDLDAARAARREKAGKAPSIRFLGEDRPLPQELPARVLEMSGAVAGGNWTMAVPAMKILMGGEVYEQMESDADEAGDELTLADVVFLLGEVLKVYEVTAPE